MAEAGNTAHPQVTQRQVLTAGFASVLAWSLDLFDLLILLYVASTIAPLFFATDQPTLSLAATYASYAVTLIMRPAGSAIFGNFADRRGRLNFHDVEQSLEEGSDLSRMGAGAVGLYMEPVEDELVIAGMNSRRCLPASWEGAR